MRLSRLLLLTALAAAGAVVGRAADWPQWRGPDRTDVSRDTGLVKAWPKAGPPLLWTFKEAGVGYSGPAIVGDMLYCMGAEDKTEYLYGLDTKAQKKVWSTEIGPLLKEWHGDGPRGTPTVDGDLAFGLGGQGNLLCVKASTGEKVWLKDLKGKEVGGEIMSDYGSTESPLVDGDQVVCTPGGPKGTLAAFDRKTGGLLWRSKDWTDKAAYSSLIAANPCGVRQYIQMTGESVAGVGRDGKLLWRCPRSGPTAPVPTPICSGGFVYVTSGYNAGCLLLELTGDAAKITCKEVYKNKNLINHHGGVILVGDHLYGYDDGKKGLVCQNFKTGEVVWSEESKHGKLALTCADGQLYCFGARDGAVLLVEATPAGYKENGCFVLPALSKLRSKSGATWTHPVVANGKLYLRDQELLFCYDVR